MLALLSLLAMLSDWVCFSVAPIPGLTQLAYSGVHPASLVTLFLFTNVFFCLVEPIIVKRYGLRDTIIFGAMLMAIGCILRSGLPGYPTTSAGVVMLGTVFVGAAQPFFQCTPALLAAEWFGPNERTLALLSLSTQIKLELRCHTSAVHTVHDVGDFHGYFLIWLSLHADFSCVLQLSFEAGHRHHLRVRAGTLDIEYIGLVANPSSSLNNATAPTCGLRGRFFFVVLLSCGGMGRSRSSSSEMSSILLRKFVD